MLNKDISRKVLSVSSDYKDYRGGIGAVLQTYSEYFYPFHFVASYPNSNLKPFWLILLKYIYSFFRIAYILMLNWDIKIVHIHMAERGSFYRKYLIFILVKRIFNKKVILHSHGAELKQFYLGLNSFFSCRFKYLINNVDCLICLSPQWLRFFEDNFSPKKVAVLENIVDDPIVSKDEFRQVELISFLFLGEIGNRKGIYDLIDVIIMNKDILNGRVCFYIGGDGEVEKLIGLIHDNKIEHLVEFCGWISGDSKVKYLNMCDVFLLPSYDEGLPISILEAMSYGMAIISTKVGGIPEVVKDGVNGWLFQSGDKITLCELILNFVEDPNLIRILGDNSLEIIKPYMACSVINKLENIYRQL